MRRRVLVLTRDMIPTPGNPTAGGGLRAWGLGEALKLQGHEVVYSVPEKLVPAGDEYDELRRQAFSLSDLHTSILRAEPDVVLLEQWGLATHLSDTSLPVVLDLHGSLILENAFRQHRSWTSNAAAKIKALRKADLVICPGLRQQAYFMSWMMMSGADPTDIPVEVVPVSMPAEQPERGADFDGPLELVYGGQLWPWIEPGTALVAATELLEELGSGTLNLFVNEPLKQEILPYDDSTQVQTWQMPERVLKSEVVKQEGMVSREEMIQRYAGAHLAIDLYAWNTERALAYTTRTVEYMWCGLPVIYGHYGELGQLIKEYEAGWLVDPSKPDQVRGAIREALTDRAELKRRSENANKLVYERLSWGETIHPLARWVDDPVVRPKGETIFGNLALEFDRIKTEAKERIEPMERDLKSLVEEVANRDARIVALTDELARRERLAAEEAEGLRGQVLDHGRQKSQLEEALRQSQVQGDKQGVEVAEREREIRQLQGKLDGAEACVEDLKVEVEDVREQLGCEQRDHSQTVAKYGTTRNELNKAEHRVEELEQELEGMQADLKGAVAKITTQAEEFDQCRQELEEEVQALRNNELELRKDVAAEAARADEMVAQVEQAGEISDGLKEQMQALRKALRDMRYSWAERTAATGEHALRRVAVQVPAVAGLWVRNLANNAYMTIWQKRNNVRIFPGQ